VKATYKGRRMPTILTLGLPLTVTLNLFRIAEFHVSRNPIPKRWQRLQTADQYQPSITIRRQYLTKTFGLKISCEAGKVTTTLSRDSGICPIREELHKQCFDEIIRQVTIDSPERGILLMRVRDELYLTINAYETLYESSLTFSMRKQLQAEQGAP